MPLRTVIFAGIVASLISVALFKAEIANDCTTLNKMVVFGHPYECKRIEK